MFYSNFNFTAFPLKPMATEGHRPPMGGGHVDAWRIPVGNSHVPTMSISTSPLAFGDGIQHFTQGTKVKIRSGMPLVINEGDLLSSSKKVSKVVGKGESVMVEGTATVQFKTGKVTGAVDSEEASPLFKIKSITMLEDNLIVEKGSAKFVMETICSGREGEQPAAEMLGYSLKKVAEGAKGNHELNYSDLVRVHDCDSRVLGMYKDVPNEVTTRPMSSNQQNDWSKKENIKVLDLDLGEFLSEDGSSVKLHEDKEMENSRGCRILL